MKKLIVLLAVFALTAPVCADVTLNVVDNGNGTVTVTAEADNVGLPCVGIGLVATSTGGDITAVAAPASPFFNVYVDGYHDTPAALNDNDFSDDGLNPGANPNDAGLPTLPDSTVSLSMGELNDAADAQPNVVYELAVLSIEPSVTEVCLDLDDLRGGIVDTGGAAAVITNTLPACFTLGPAPCPCRGDIADEFGLPPGDGSVVGFGDLNYMVDELSANGFNISVAARPDLICADIADQFGQASATGDGAIDFGDLNYMVDQMALCSFNCPCLP